jgi:hypothetical protein
VALIYAASSGSDDRPALAIEIARSFAHTLVPIAARCCELLLAARLQRQRRWLPGVDPLGKGWDLFGTADKAIDYGVVSATAIWYVQVGVLVAGHVCGLILAHDRALALYGKARAATTSQYWMLAVMVAFTTFGLFLLSQANQ